MMEDLNAIKTGDENQTSPTEEIVQSSDQTSEPEGGDNAADGGLSDIPKPYHKDPNWQRIIKQRNEAQAEAKAQAERLDQMLALHSQTLKRMQELEAAPQQSQEPTVLDQLRSKIEAGEELSQSEMLLLIKEQQEVFNQRLQDVTHPYEEQRRITARQQAAAELMQSDPFFTAGKFANGKPGNVLAFHILGNLMAEADPTGTDTTKLAEAAAQAKKITTEALAPVLLWAAEAKDQNVLAVLPEVMEKARAAKDPGVLKYLEKVALGWKGIKDQQQTSIPGGGGGKPEPNQQHPKPAATLAEAEARVRAKLGL